MPDFLDLTLNFLSFGLDGVVLVDPELVKGKKGELSPLLLLHAHPSVSKGCRCG